MLLMKQNFLIVIGLILAGSIIVGVWQIKRLQDDVIEIAIRTTPQDEQAAETQQFVDHAGNRQMAEDLEELGEVVNVLTEQVNRLSSRLDDLGDGKKTPPLQQQVENIEKPPVLTQQQRIMLLETALYDEAVTDEIWSSATTVKVEQLVQNAPEYRVAESINVECGGVLCKIQASLPADASRSEKDLFEVKMTFDLAKDLPRATMANTIGPDGSTKYVFYMARKGYLLPTEGGGAMPILTGEQGDM